MNDGYARNFILPKKLGVEATGKNLNDLKLQKITRKKWLRKILTLRKNLQRNYRQAKSSLRSKSAKAEERYGSVSSKEIAVVGQRSDAVRY